jgi:tetratricopeptide (TPR) repeat protein
MCFVVSSYLDTFSRLLAKCFLLFVVVGLQARAAQNPSDQSSSSSADQHYEQGVQFLSQEQWQSAASAFEETLKVDARRADAENGLGVALGKLGDQKGSENAFHRAIGIDPAYAEAHYNLALWLQESGDIQQAISELNTAIKLRPAYEAAQLALGALFQRLGEPEKSAEIFKAVVHEDPRSAEAHNSFGVAYGQKNDVLDAIAEFQQAVDLDPEYLEAYNNLALALARAKRFDDAVRVFHSVLALAPKNVELRLNLSRALRGKGNLDTALIELRSILKDGDNAQAECEIAEVLGQKHDFRGAIEASEKALVLNPGMDNAYAALGLALRGQAAVVSKNLPAHPHAPSSEAQKNYDSGRELLTRRDITSAEAEFERAVQADPTWAEAQNLLGFVLGQSGDLQAAIDHLRKSVTLDPLLATARYNLGVALWYVGQQPESLTELHTAIGLDPAFAEAYSFLGMISEQNGELDDARQHLQRAISVNPDLLGARVDLGIVLLKKSQSKAAFEDFQSLVNKESTDQIPDLEPAVDAVQEWIKQHEDDAFAHDTLGLLLGKAGRDSQIVIEQFRKAIQVRPTFAEAHNHLGLALIQTGSDDEAIKEFREAIRLNPNYAEAHENLGATLTSKNDDEAISELERAIRLQPASVKAQYNLAMAYLPKYGLDKEIEQLQKVIALDPKLAEAYYSLGKALMQKGQLQEAISLLRDAVALDPISGPTHYQLGLALSRTDKTDEGKLELDKGLKLTADDERNRKADALKAQAKLDLDKGETQQAAETLGKLVQLLPDYAEGHLTFAQTLAKLGDVQRSTTEFKRVLELDPNLYAAHFGLGQLLLANGNLRDAESEFREAIRLRPSSADAYDELGLALSQERDENGAAAAFQKAWQLDPGNAEAQKNLDLIRTRTASSAQTSFGNATGSGSSLNLRTSTGELLPIGTDDLDQIKNFETTIEKDKIDEVEPLVASYLEGHPTSWRAHYIQGYLLFRMRKVGDSIRELSKSLELNVADPEAHKILAKDFVIIGQVDYALTELQQAVRLKPESAEIHYSLGEIYSAKDMLPESKSEFMAAIQRDATYAEAYNALGFTEESLDHEAAALEAYKKAIDVADKKGFKYDAPYINLSAYYNRLGNPELALQYAQKAIELDANSDLAYYQMARAYESRHELEKAADALAKAISIMPSSAQYFYVLSQVDRKLGKQKESMEALQTFEKLKHEAELVDNKILENRQRPTPGPEATKQ